LASRTVELDGLAVAPRILVERAHGDGEILTLWTCARRDDEQTGACHTIGCKGHVEALPRRLARAALNPQPRPRQTGDADFHRARPKLHIAQLQRVIVADRTVGELNIERTAPVLDGKIEPGALAEG